MPAPKKKPTCLTCKNKPHSRGLCWACLQAARVKIESGRTTEDELIRRNLMLPLKPQGRKRKDSFEKAFSRK